MANKPLEFWYIKFQHIKLHPLHTLTNSRFTGAVMVVVLMSDLYLCLCLETKLIPKIELVFPVPLTMSRMNGQSSCNITHTYNLITSKFTNQLWREWKWVERDDFTHSLLFLVFVFFRKWHRSQRWPRWPQTTLSTMLIALPPRWSCYYQDMHHYQKSTGQ